MSNKGQTEPADKHMDRFRALVSEERRRLVEDAHSLSKKAYVPCYTRNDGAQLY